MKRRMKMAALVLLLLSGMLADSPRLLAYTPPLTVQFASSYYVVNEDAGTAVLTVTLSQPASAVVTVNYATSNGTAKEGTDYDAASGIVTFPPNVTSQNIEIGILNNGNFSDQTVYFTVTLSGPVNAALGALFTATVYVLDNNLPPFAYIGIEGVRNKDNNDPGGSSR